MKKMGDLIKSMLGVIILSVVWTGLAHAALNLEKEDSSTDATVNEVEESAPAVLAPAAAEPEAKKKFEAVQNQELWVAKLQKQLEGERSQLNQMRISLAQSFELDVKKLEKGAYHFDAKSGKFVEK